MQGEHSTAFYIVAGGFWLAWMLVVAMAAAIIGDRESYDAMRKMWVQCRKDCGI